MIIHISIFKIESFLNLNCLILFNHLFQNNIPLKLIFIILNTLLLHDIFIFYNLSFLNLLELFLKILNCYQIKKFIFITLFIIPIPNFVYFLVFMVIFPL